MLHSHPQSAPAAPSEGPRTTPFRINPDLDLDVLARTYATEGRVRIHGLLADGARQLYEYLHGSSAWIHLISTDAGALELDRAARKKMSVRARERLEAEVHRRACLGFQYRYEALRVPDAEEFARRDDPLTDFARLMSSAPMLDFLRAVTGHDGLAFTDGQATAYGSGDFLTCHDDDVAGKNRLAAYVFGMTPQWRPEWGGLLLFHGADDKTVDGHVPMFNTLDLFKVPRNHSVSYVTPSAPTRRYAVTGWLRAGTR